jgi:hypothetical protein
MTTKNHESTWDPNLPGPLDRCLRCWTPINNDVAYCLTCGQTTLVFKDAMFDPGENRCFWHGEKNAVRLCCLCLRPVCEECKSKETNPLTLPRPLWYCRHCCDTQRSFENEFLESLPRTRCCSKHRELPAAFSCQKCSLPLCLSCTYFSVSGFWRKQISNGPLCLGCFRTAVPSTTRKNWLSGHDVGPAFIT